MKQFIPLLFCFFCNSLAAQDWTIGTRWLYYQDDWFPDLTKEYQLLEVSGDTIITNDTLLILDEFYVVKGLNGILNYHQMFRHFVRKSGDQVFIKGSFSDQMYLLYDFSAVEGDTLTVKVPGNYSGSDEDFIRVRIDSVLEIDYGGTLRTVQYVSTVESNSGYYFNYFIIKGIGGYFFLMPVAGFVDPPPGGGLLCFNNGTFNFPESTQCDLILPTLEISKSFIRVYPNPAKDIVQIESLDFVIWEIFDARGIKRLNGSNNENPDISILPAGSYYLVLYNEKGHTLFTKTIVRR